MSKSIYTFVALSLFVHFGFWLSAQFFPTPTPATTSRLIFEIADSPVSTKTKQVVRSSQPPKEDLTTESNEDLVFLSENTQRVRKQQRASESGMTQNRTQANNNIKEPSARNSSDLGLSPRAPNSIDQMLQQGLSTVGESLPQEVAIGSFTALNTDRFTYYSFFSRVEELIRFRWETRIRSAIQRMPPEQLQAVVRSQHLSQLEVVINLNGDIEKIRLLKSSGFRAFDEAPANAFWEARVLNNPPSQLADEDSKIRLQYSFKVQIPTMPMARSN